MTIIDTLNDTTIARIQEYAKQQLEYTAKFMPDGKFVNDHVSWETHVETCAAIGLQMDGKIVCLLEDTAYFSVNPIYLAKPEEKDETAMAVENAQFPDQDKIPHLSTWSCGGNIQPGRFKTWEERIADYNKSLFSASKAIIGVYKF